MYQLRNFELGIIGMECGEVEEFANGLFKMLSDVLNTILRKWSRIFSGLWFWFLVVVKIIASLS